MLDFRALCTLNPQISPPIANFWLRACASVSLAPKFFLCPWSWPWPRVLCPRLHLCSKHCCSRITSEKIQSKAPKIFIVTIGYVIQINMKVRTKVKKSGSLKNSFSATAMQQNTVEITRKSIYLPIIKNGLNTTLTQVQECSLDFVRYAFVQNQANTFGNRC